MEILVIVFLVCAALGLVLSIITTVKLFKDFTAEETPEGRIERLKKYRRQPDGSFRVSQPHTAAASHMSRFMRLMRHALRMRSANSAKTCAVTV